MLKGEVLIPFVAQLEGGHKFRGVVGRTIEIPPNVDWVTAGFVRVVEDDEDTTPAPKAKRKKASEG